MSLFDIPWPCWMFAVCPSESRGGHKSLYLILCLILRHRATSRYKNRGHTWMPVFMAISLSREIFWRLHLSTVSSTLSLHRERRRGFEPITEQHRHTHTYIHVHTHKHTHTHPGTLWHRSKVSEPPPPKQDNI